MRITVVLLISILITMSACKKDQMELDDIEIQNYLTDHDLTATKHESGLYYIIQEEGTGEEHPDIASNITIKYKGYLTDGHVFDQTTDYVSFNLFQLIEGWQIGIPLLKRNGSGIFFIPSSLGYGENEVGTIPANSVLIFEIDLLDFN